MRLTTLLAFSCLVACKSQPQTGASTAPAVAPEAEEDEWNGFGGNEHAEDEEPADAVPEGTRVRQLCERMAGLIADELDTAPANGDATGFVEGCVNLVEGQMALDSETVELFEECILSSDTATKARACLEQSDEEAEAQPRDPEDLLVRVCEKMAELAEKEPDLPQEAKVELAKVDKCIEEGRKEYEKDPEKFERLANCVLDASSMDDVLTCAMENKEL